MKVIDDHETREAKEAERQQEQRSAEIDRETTGMRHAFDALQPLDYNGRRRALRWLTEALENAEVPF